MIVMENELESHFLVGYIMGCIFIALIHWGSEWFFASGGQERDFLCSDSH